MQKLIKQFFPLICVFILTVCQTSAPVQEEPRAELSEHVSDTPLSENDRQGFAETRPEIQNRDELTVVFSRHNVELDFRKSYFASEAQIFTGIYEGLFSYHPSTLSPVPAAAESVNLSEDRTTWTFTIRRNARYANGDTVRAEDFRAAWISLLDPNRDSPYSSLFDIIQGARDYRTGVEKDPANVGIRAPDDRTLIVQLNSPAAFFPSMLCHHSFSPIHPSMLEVENWSPSGNINWRPPVTNGPFFIDTMDDDSIVLLKSEHYWDRRNVALNKITIKLIESDDEAALLWNTGEARWIAGNVNLEALTDRSGIQVNVMFATHYYFIRGEQSPWNDHRVRRAMALVLPWDEIRSGHFLPTSTLIFPISGYPRVEGLTEPDYEEARKLMAEAGFENGIGAPELVIRLTPSRDAARIGSLMAVAWKEELGFNVRVEVVPFEDYFDSLKQSGYVIGSSTWIGDFADPYTFLQMWRRDSNLNDALHDDEDYEKLMEKSMMEEGSARFATLAEAETLLLERGAVLPISHSPALNIIDMSEIDGWFPNALDIHPFKYLNFRTFRPLPGIVMAVQ